MRSDMTLLSCDGDIVCCDLDMCGPLAWLTPGSQRIRRVSGSSIFDWRPGKLALAPQVAAAFQMSVTTPHVNDPAAAIAWAGPWTAPEVLAGAQTSPASDVYGFAMIMYQARQTVAHSRAGAEGTPQCMCSAASVQRLACTSDGAPEAPLPCSLGVSIFAAGVRYRRLPMPLIPRALTSSFSRRSSFRDERRSRPTSACMACC